MFVLLWVVGPIVQTWNPGRVLFLIMKPWALLVPNLDQLSPESERFRGRILSVVAEPRKHVSASMTGESDFLLPSNFMQAQT